MAVSFEPFVNWMLENILFFLLLGGFFLGFAWISRQMKKIPRMEDYTKVFKDQDIVDQQLNKPDKYEPKWLYRGHELLGKIIAYDEQPHEDIVSKEQEKFMIEGFRETMTVLTFVPKLYGKICIGKGQILRFKSKEAKVEEDKLVFPSTTGFTALGHEYVTKASFKESASIIEGTYAKRLFEANVNLFASRMAHISAETPEMAHELALRRLDIDRIKAEKQMKMGQLI